MIPWRFKAVHIVAYVHPINCAQSFDDLPWFTYCSIRNSFVISNFLAVNYISCHVFLKSLYAGKTVRKPPLQNQ